MDDWTLFADWHTHTCYSDGRGTIIDNARAGQRSGLEELALTDHGPATLAWGIKTPAYTLKRMRAEIEDWNSSGRSPHLLLGVEANVVSVAGQLDLAEELIKLLDILIVSLHPLVKPAGWKDALTMFVPNLLERYGRLRGRRLRDLNTKALTEAVRNYPVDFVAHPGLGLDIDTAELARVCARRGTALEINCRHAHDLKAYLQAALPSGVDFVINSDAHKPEAVGQLALGIHLAKNLGLPPQRIKNAQLKGDYV